MCWVIIGKSVGTLETEDGVRDRAFAGTPRIGHDGAMFRGAFPEVAHRGRGSSLALAGNGAGTGVTTTPAFGPRP